MIQRLNGRRQCQHGGAKSKIVAATTKTLPLEEIGSEETSVRSRSWPCRHRKGFQTADHVRDWDGISDQTYRPWPSRV